MPCASLGAPSAHAGQPEVQTSLGLISENTEKPHAKVKRIETCMRAVYFDASVAERISAEDVIQLLVHGRSLFAKRGLQSKPRVVHCLVP